MIGGRWKRTPLPVVDVPGLRPTPDRVRETLFNWLTHALVDLGGRPVLDLFAGTGALGFEAASRGAAPVVLVESHPAASAQLEANRAKLGADQVEIHLGDALRIASRLLASGRRFDAVLLDPPFDTALLEAALPLAALLCNDDGFVYAESNRPLRPDVVDAAGLATCRADKAGEVFYHLLQRKKRD